MQRLRAGSPAQGRDIPSIAITAHYEDSAEGRRRVLIWRRPATEPSN